MAKNDFMNELIRSRTAAGSASRGAAATGSVDHAEILKEAVEMMAEGLAGIHAALDAESEADGSEPVPGLLPGSLDDEFEALADALADFANAAADAIGEPIEIEIDADEE